jgi:hypothetical protein
MSKRSIIDCLDRIDNECDNILERADLLLGIGNEKPNPAEQAELILDDLKDIRRALEELRELTR